MQVVHRMGPQTGGAGVSGALEGPDGPPAVAQWPRRRELSRVKKQKIRVKHDKKRNEWIRFLTIQAEKPGLGNLHKAAFRSTLGFKIRWLKC